MRNKLLLLLMVIFAAGCEDPNVERDPEYMNIYIPKSHEKSDLLQTVPIVYNTVNFVKLTGLDFNKDTVLLVGAYCGGMILNGGDITLEFALAEDSLASLQNKPVSQAVYKNLPAEYYTVDNWTVRIPKNDTNGYLKVNLKNSLIPENSQFILPLRIKSSSKYSIDPSFSFILLAIDR